VIKYILVKAEKYNIKAMFRAEIPTQKKFA